MVTSEARREANRQNALKSTGPRTLEGKEASRANALKHGLCSAVVVRESPELVQARSAEFAKSLQPRNEVQCWHVAEVALVSIRLDRCQQIERQVRDKAALQAHLCWDDDRQLAAATLAQTLGKQPEIVVEQLTRTPQGCEWLMGRWAMLAYVANQGSPWTPEQVDLAFDLLGTPKAFRTGQNPGVVIDLDGRETQPGASQLAIARREVEKLKARREIVGELDDARRSLAEADLSDETDPELRRLRRYESSLHSRMRRAMAVIRQPESLSQSVPGPMNQWQARTNPPPRPAEPAAPTRVDGLRSSPDQPLQTASDRLGTSDFSRIPPARPQIPTNGLRDRSDRPELERLRS